MLLGSSIGADSVSLPQGFDLSTTKNTTGACVWLRSWDVPSLDRRARFATNPGSNSWLAYSGNPIVEGQPMAGASGSAEDLLARFEAHDTAALADIDGGFAIAWWNEKDRQLCLIRDRFGIEPLVYTETDSRVWFASRVRDLVSVGAAKKELCAEGLAQFLVFCYVPGNNSLHKNVSRVPPGTVLRHEVSKPSRIERWYSLSYSDPWQGNEQEIADEYREQLERAVVRRLYGGDPGILLSGGMDSSSVATFARKHWQGDIHSYGFRCSGASFDESYYARALSEELNTQHSEVDFGEQESSTIIKAIDEMEVPFCNVGIEVGTWLLGGIARGGSEYLLTGDGGDEMWASHPVYAAQRVMQYYDKLHVPSFIHNGIWKLASMVPDSDKKRNLPVIIKRILPPPGISRDLRHFRWRAYYAPRQFEELATQEWKGKLRETDPMAFAGESFEGYQGPDDGISPLLYSDYTTESSFYFSRLMLCRHFGLEVRMPFYDREFVEFGARIPARLKLEGLERTKRLFRVAMEGVLPDVINNRKDKLGHSVPLKNWLRDQSLLSQEIEQTLSRKTVESRGLFNYEFVKKMLDEHTSRKHNHSHRIWAFFVLEKWLQRHMS